MDLQEAVATYLFQKMCSNTDQNQIFTTCLKFHGWQNSFHAQMPLRGKILEVNYWDLAENKHSKCVFQRFFVRHT